MNEMIEKHFDDESVPEVSLSDWINKFYNVLIKLNLVQFYYYRGYTIGDQNSFLRRQLLVSNLLPRIKGYALDSND